MEDDCEHALARYVAAAPPEKGNVGGQIIMKQMNKTILVIVLAGWSLTALAGEQSNAQEFWQSQDRSVIDKVSWATTYFATNACTFADVTHLLGKPNSTSRTGAEVPGFRMRYDALYYFTNGTINLVFLLPQDKESWNDTVLHSIRYAIHRTQRDVYAAKWTETKIETRQSGGRGLTQ